MLVIFDSTGTTYFAGTGYKTPSGTLSCLEIEVPEGKYLNGVDTSVDPPQPIFKDIPKTETEKLKEEVEMLKGSILEMSKDVYA